MTKDKIKAVIVKETREWLRRTTAESLRARVIGRLEEQVENLICKALGFRNDSWKGRDWMVDNCNGRRGESELGDFLRSNVRQGVDEWLSKLQDGKLPPPPAGAKKAYKEAYNEIFLDKVRALAYKHAEEHAKVMFEEVAKELGA